MLKRRHYHTLFGVSRFVPYTLKNLTWGGSLAEDKSFRVSLAHFKISKLNGSGIFTPSYSTWMKNGKDQPNTGIEHFKYWSYNPIQNKRKQNTGNENSYQKKNFKNYTPNMAPNEYFCTFQIVGNFMKYPWNICMLITRDCVEK